MQKTGALIIASHNLTGESGDNEEIPMFLPMYPLDGTTIIKREIAALRRAGVSPILVQLGYQGEVLRNHLSHNGVRYVEEEDWDAHSPEQSLAFGLAEAADHMDRTVVIPVEYPAFSQETLGKLLLCPNGAAPVREGQRGYPRLYLPAEGPNAPLEDCPVEDPGVLLPVRGEEGIRQAEQYMKELRDANELQCRLRLILSKEEDFFGPGVYRLLKAIDETGSIQAAAASMQMSYTKGWKMINQAEKEMGFLFLNRCNGGKHGGSSTITEEGRLFMKRYHALEEDLKRISQRFFDTYFSDFQ